MNHEIIPESNTEAKKSFFGKFREKVPLLAFIIYCIAVFSAIIHVTAIFSPSFADFFNRYISSGLRALLSYITGWIPFSFAETIFICIPVIAIILFVFCFKVNSDEIRATRFLSSLLAVLAAFYSIFALNFGTGYHTHRIDEKLGLTDGAISLEELRETAVYIADRITDLNRDIDFLLATDENGNIDYSTTGFSYMPYSLSELNDKLIEAYDKTCDKYDFIQRLDSRIKPIVLSEPMTYTHISGVYSYFTGEANINVNFPDYTLPFTAAHELAHQRGIAREDEASFVAFLVCMDSDDLYIRYSGYINILEYLLSSLSATDTASFNAVVKQISAGARGEINAYNRFFEKYRDSAASNVTDKINDTYLKIQGTEGTQSYGLVVDLAVAYMRTVRTY